MEKQLFEELVSSLREAAASAQAYGHNRRTRRRLAEHIRAVREARQIIGPRAFIKTRPKSKCLRARELSRRAAVRRKAKNR